MARKRNCVECDGKTKPKAKKMERKWEGRGRGSQEGQGGGGEDVRWGRKGREWGEIGFPKPNKMN